MGEKLQSIKRGQNRRGGSPWPPVVAPDGSLDWGMPAGDNGMELTHRRLFFVVVLLDGKEIDG